MEAHGSTQTSSDHHPQEELAKFGYRWGKKIKLKKKFKNPAIFLQLVCKTYCLNMAISEYCSVSFNFSIINNFSF
jgi:hypothetical protein